LVNTISIPKNGDRDYWLSDIDVADMGGQTLGVVTGEMGIAVADTVIGSFLFPASWPQAVASADGQTTLGFSYQSALGRIADKDVAVVVGLVNAPAGTTPLALAVVDLTDPAVPVLLGWVALVAPGFSATDVILKGDQAFVGMQGAAGGRTLVVSLANLSQPRVVGTIPNVGGRLSIGDNGILYGSAYSPFGGNSPIGGVRTATLKRLGIIRNVSPMPVEYGGSGTVSARDVTVGAAVVPAGLEVQSARVRIYRDAVVEATLPAQLTGSEARAVWPRGQPLNLRAKYYAEAVFDEATSQEIVSAKRLIPFVVLDVDVDSDNNNALADPARTQAEDDAEDVVSEVRKPGKVVFVNEGDTDGDGIPDWADGVDKFDQAVADASGRFTPLIVQLPPDVDLSAATVKLQYSGSNPAGLQRTGTVDTGFTYSLPAGALRIWTRDGGQARKTASVVDGGDFVPGFTEIPVASLGAPLRERTWRLYVEGLRVSGEIADQQIKIEAAFPDTGGGTLRVADTVRTTLLNLRLVQADASNGVQPVRDFKFSHPSPTVTISQAQLANLRVSDDGARVLGDLGLVGSVSCSVCDYTPGDLGRIDSVRVFLNDRETVFTTLPVSSSKADEAPSLLKPFAYTGSFSGVLEGIEIQDGANLVRVDVADKVYGITGYTELSLEVVGTPPAPVVVDYRAALDFGGAQSLAELTPERPVRLTLVDRVSSRSFTGEVFRTSEEPLVFGGPDATVTIFDPAQLDAALSGSVVGTVRAGMSVPEIAAFGFSYDLRETSAGSSVFARDVVSLEVDFAGPLSASVPDVVEVVAEGAGSTVSASLTETGAETQVFASADGGLVLRIPVSQPQGGQAAGVLDVVLTSSALGVTGRPLTVMETDAGSGLFRTNETSLLDSFDRSSFAGFTYTAKEPVFLGASTGGEFNPYMLQMQGPEAFLSQLSGIETADGPRAVKKAFDGNYYVFMKNSPPGT
jgi:hypothetical protein